MTKPKYLDAELEATSKGGADTAMNRASRIRELNDAFRRTFSGGRVVLTRGVSGLPATEQAAILAAVRGFTAFTADNDPHGEHDFGTVEHGELRIFWKIDAYDRDLEFGSPDPADPAVTTRVLTVMLTEEY